MHLVERMQVAVIGLVNAYFDRLMRDIAPALRARFDAEPFPIGHVGGQVSLGEQFLQTTFRMVDRQAAEDLSRVIPVPSGTVLKNATHLEDRFIKNNTELIKLDERAREEVRKVIEGPLREGIRVEEVRKLIEERLGVVRSRAILIARDQTTKLYGQIQEARQTEAGVVEYTWSTSEDERVRGTPGGKWPKGNHFQLDGTTQRWDSPPLVDQASGRHAHPGGDIQCLPGYSQIGFTGPIHGAFRRWFTGELTELITVTGETVECTPNHPVLTASGWKAAELVQVGDDVLLASEECPELAEADVEHGETRIAEIFDALALALGTTRHRAVTAQFHGDARADDEIDVVDADDGLRLDLESTLAKLLRELPLADADEARPGLRAATLTLGALGLASSGGVGGLRLRLAQFFRRALEANDIGQASTAGLDAVTEQEIANGLALDPVALGEALDRGACSLQLQAFLLGQWLRIVRWSVHAARPELGDDGELADRLLVHAELGTDVAPGQRLRAKRARILEVRRREFSGHVYNLSTAGNWYVAEGVILHNCRCAAIPILPLDGLEAPDNPPAPGEITPTEPGNDVTAPPENDVSLPEVEFVSELTPPPANDLETELHAEAQRAALERARAEQAALEAELRRLETPTIPAPVEPPIPEPPAATELPPDTVPPSAGPSSSEPPSSAPPREEPAAKSPLEALGESKGFTVVTKGTVSAEHEAAVTAALERLRVGQGNTLPLPHVEVTSRVGKSETKGRVQLPRGTGGVYLDSEWLGSQGRDPEPVLRVGVSEAHVSDFIRLGVQEGRDPWQFRPTVSRVLPNGADVGRFDVPGNTQQLALTAAEVIEWTTTHEYGHHLHLAATDPEIDRLIEEAYRDRRSQPVSTYAMVDAREFFAEAFTAYHHYPREWLEKNTPKSLRLVERVLELSGLK